MVLSLETGALISVWLCWLSFSSISTVQQEKPCGHTFNGAPGREEEGTVKLCDEGNCQHVTSIQKIGFVRIKSTYITKVGISLT